MKTIVSHPTWHICDNLLFDTLTGSFLSLHALNNKLSHVCHVGRLPIVFTMNIITHYLFNNLPVILLPSLHPWKVNSTALRIGKQIHTWYYLCTAHSLFYGSLATVNEKCSNCDMPISDAGIRFFNLIPLRRGFSFADQWIL